MIKKFVREFDKLIEVLDQGARGIEYRSDLARVGIAILLYRLAEDSGLVLRGTFQDLIGHYFGPKRHENMWLRGEENLWYHLRKLFQEFRRRYGGVPISLRSSGQVEFEDFYLKKVLQLSRRGTMAPGVLTAEWIGIGYERGIVGARRSQTRRRAGTYHTPPYLVKYLLESSLGVHLNRKLDELGQAFSLDDTAGVERILKEVRLLKLCDPSCGCGVFLIHAMDRFVAFYEGYNRLLSEWTAQAGDISLFDEHLALEPVVNPEKTAITENIRGVEINREAMLLGSALLAMKVIARAGASRSSSVRLETFANRQIWCGDALAWGPASMGAAARSGSSVQGEILPDTPVFDWWSYFPDVFGLPGEPRDETSGFDFIVGNPPWGAKLVTGSRYLKKRYPILDSHNPDSYKYFVHLGYELLKEGGTLAYVLPNSLMDMELHTDIRAFLLKKTQICQVVNLSSSIFTDGKIPAMLMIFTRGEPDYRKGFPLVDFSKAAPRALKSLDLEKAPHVKQKKFLKTLGNRFIMPRSATEEKTLKKIRKLGQPLSAALSGRISRGLVTGQDKYFIFEYIPEWVPEKYLRPIVKGKEIKPFVVTGNRYLMSFDEPPPGKFVQKLLTWFRTVVRRDPKTSEALYTLRSQRPDELFTSPKILLLRTGRRLVAAPDLDQNLAAVDTLYMVRPQDENHVLFLTALLNSCIFNWLYSATAGSSKDIFPEIRPAPLHILPLVLPGKADLQDLDCRITRLRELLMPQEKAELSESAPVRFGAGEETKAVRLEIEDALFNLYEIPQPLRKTLIHRYLPSK